MADPRVHELQAILPRCLLPDWVRLGSRLVRLLRDQHHPASHDAVLQRLIEQARASVALRERRAARVPRVSYPPDLPVAARHEEIVAAIREHQVVVIAGETGSGKTTQIPKMCLEAGLGIEAKIGCTQPRRVAALSISQRIAEELNVEWGREVGCKIRFDDRSSGETYIKLMTDGILLAETQGDPVLSEYNALILDEAHERSLNIDFLLGYLKGLLAKRVDLKLVITSATIDTDAFSRHFGGAPIIEVSGRTFPVDIIYAPFEHEADTEETGSGERGTRNEGRLSSHGSGHVVSAAPSPHSALEADIRSALYSPDDSLTYIDAAVRVTEAILCDSASGDLLIFLPGERDIRELRDLLDGRFGGEAEIVPLFGRLSSGEQQRVFAPTIRRKIVIATNIAETSLTIPGIRYVIDAGLARMSRYNPRTRTRRLPIEAVSQSSANQRKGRAGRVQDGICVRLYSEEDFLARPPHTQPEIQRANLAEVILRMKAFHLGEIEVFPFLNPPTPSAIDNGYKLLQELGALDEARALTALGEQLARLPIDPTLGRMLLQALAEGAANEMLVIAAGLSIQDPRERPLDQKDAAASAHKRFNHPRSDFLTLLNIWDAVHDEWERLRTQNQRRRFCRTHFLSYLRMVEWQDVHGQLEDALEELQRRTDAAPRPANAPAASYDAIHRSVLAGLLGHIARREERNAYKAAGNRVLNVFPGSGLFERMDRKPQPRNVDRNARDCVKPATPPSHQPEWIVAGEIVETSQLFARTLAGIDPVWIVQLASHLCKRTHSNPRWVASQARVLADERITMHGLEVQMRRVDYGNINPREATEIFIRTALVEEQLFPGTSREDDESADADVRSGKGRRGPARVQRHAALHQLAPDAEGGGRTTVPPQFRFIEINRAVREKISHWRTRVRQHDLPDVDEAMFRFYATRISDCSSRDALSRLLREHAAQPDFLCVTERDLVGERALSYDAQAFPDRVTLDEQPVALRYAYAPGEDWDGVTVQLPVGIAQTINESAVVWAVPGLREAQALELLRSLPRMLRRDLMPLAEKAAEIARDFKPVGKSFLEDLAQFIHRNYGVPVQATSWPADALPMHLRPRVELMGPDRKSLGASRDLESLRRTIEQPKAAPVRESSAWVRAAAQWERAALTGWTFGDLPERITVSEAGGLPVYAWPGLRVEDGHVCVRLFPGAETARRESLPGLRRLVELALQRDLGWVQKDLRALVRFEPMLVGWMTADELQVTAFEGLKLSILPGEPLPVLTQSLFEQEVELARRRVPGAAQKLVDQLTTVLPLRQEVARKCPPPAKPAAAQKLTDFRQLGAAPVMATASRGYTTMAEDLAALMPKRFLETMPPDRRTHLPRYLKAMLVRFERAANNPAKDQERAKQLAPYAEFVRTCKLPAGASTATLAAFEELRWMVEEFRVSLFAQELGTAVPVSAKRLDQQVTLVKAGGA